MPGSKSSRRRRMGGSKSMRRRRGSKSGGSMMRSADQVAKSVLNAALRANRDARKSKIISKTLRGLSGIDYKNERANAFRPLANVGADVASVLGYGRRRRGMRMRGGSKSSKSAYVYPTLRTM